MLQNVSNWIKTLAWDKPVSDLYTPRGVLTPRGGRTQAEEIATIFPALLPTAFVITGNSFIRTYFELTPFLTSASVSHYGVFFPWHRPTGAFIWTASVIWTEAASASQHPHQYYHLSHRLCNWVDRTPDFYCPHVMRPNSPVVYFDYIPHCPMTFQKRPWWNEMTWEMSRPK